MTERHRIWNPHTEQWEPMTFIPTDVAVTNWEDVDDLPQEPRSGDWVTDLSEAQWTFMETKDPWVWDSDGEYSETKATQLWQDFQITHGLEDVTWEVGGKRPWWHRLWMWFSG